MVSERMDSQVREAYHKSSPSRHLACILMRISLDGRVGTGEFAHGKVDPVEAGKEGGNSSGGSDDSGSSGSTGGSGKGQFAGGKVDPVEAGKKGGQSSN